MRFAKVHALVVPKPVARRTAAHLVGAAVFGFGVGTVTVLGQKELPGDWSTVANSGAVWTVAPFVVGALMLSTTLASVGGFLALAGAVVGYYTMVPVLVPGASSDLTSVAIWAAASLVAGPLFGCAGLWWRRERGWRRVVALGLLAGVFVADGAAELWHFHRTVAGLCMIGAGIAVPAVLASSWRERTFALITGAAVVPLTLGAYEVINLAFLHT